MCVCCQQLVLVLRCQERVWSLVISIRLRLSSLTGVIVQVMFVEWSGMGRRALEGICGARREVAFHALRYFLSKRCFSSVAFLDPDLKSLCSFLDGISVTPMILQITSVVALVSLSTSAVRRRRVFVTNE
ncbi:unnamed protein product [Hapterophycus canaliculatus]